MSRNSGLLLVARLVSAATTLVLLMYVGHARGGEALGLTGLGLAVGALLSALTDAGTGSLLIREGAREPRFLGRLLVAMSLWRIAVIPVASGLLWVALLALGIDRPGAVFLLAIGLVIQQFAELTRAVFIARQEMHISSAHSLVENIAWLCAIVGVLMTGASLEAGFAAGVAVLLGSAAVGMLLARARGTGRLALPRVTEVRSLLSRMGPFAAFMIVGVAYTRIDTLLVGALVPGQAILAAGAYFSSVRFIAALEYVPEAVARAIYPRLSTSYLAGPARMAVELRPAAAFLAAVSAPVPVVMLAIGPWLMVTLFGSGVESHAWLIVPLSVVVPLRYLSHLFGMALTSSDAQGRRAIAVLVALVVVLTLDLVLIPRIGIMGAVIGSVVASSVVFAVYLVQLIGMVPDAGLVRLVIRHIVLAAVAWLIGALLATPVGPVPATGIALAAYLALLAITGGIRPLLAASADPDRTVAERT
jgi:O-antigen/teichoic acid export membrane protein